MSCPKCGSNDYEFFTKNASEDCVKEYYDCNECGHSDVNYVN